jgi:hypothetical protein
MDESLKTVRLIHQLLIGVSAAIIAFGLSPDKAKQYQASLKELAALRQLSMDDYVSFARRLVTPQGREKYAAALRRVGFPKTSDPFLVQHQLYIERPKEDAPLAEFFRFFKGDTGIIYTEYNPASLKLLPIQYLLSKDCLPTGISLEEGNKATPDSYVLLTRAPRAGTIQVFVAFSRYDGDMNCGLSLPAQIDALTKTVPGSHGAEWLNSNKISPSTFLVASEQISDLVGAKSPVEASKFLEDKLNAPERDLSFLGIALSETIAVWVGPLVTALLLLFFLSHLRHLVAETVVEDRLFETFPWIGLFRDKLSKILTHSSIAFLPAIANGRLVSRSWHGSEGASVLGLNGFSLLGLALTLVVTAAGVVATLEVHRLQSKTRAEPCDPLDALPEDLGNAEKIV